MLLNQTIYKTLIWNIAARHRRKFRQQHNQSMHLSGDSSGEIQGQWGKMDDGEPDTTGNYTFDMMSWKTPPVRSP